MVRMLQLENPHYNVIGLVRCLARPNLLIQTDFLCIVQPPLF